MTINLAPELETRLRDVAARRGIAVDEFISLALQGAVVDVKGPGRGIPPAEGELLLQINEGAPEEATWVRYKALVRKRRDETLTSDEHAELIRLSDQIEEAHARRIGYLSQLAKLRGTSLESLMSELGIGPVSLGLEDYP